MPGKRKPLGTPKTLVVSLSPVVPDHSASTKGQQGAWVRHCAGALTGIGVITALFFTYKGIIGRDIMALVLFPLSWA